MGDTSTGPQGGAAAPSVLRGAALVDGTRVDVRIAAGVIAAVGPPGLPAEPGDADVDVADHVLTIAAVEPHAHLDKAFLSELLPNRTGDLLGAIEAMIAGRPLLGVEETAERAERAARLLARNGFRRVRTHADTTMDHGLTSIEALVAVRERVADVIDVEIVALCGWPISGPVGADQRALLRDALAMGADVVGGCPHLDVAGTRTATDTYLAIAADHGLPVDLHTDETLDPAVDGLSDLAAAVTASGFPQPVTASHCVSLGMQPEDRQRQVAEAVAAAGISVIALPSTNLYLQGRDHQQAMPRGLTALRALRAAGVTVAAGADNLQDPFNPLGRACPFETAGLMVWTTHVSPDDAWAMVTTGASVAVGVAPIAVATGMPADLVAVPASSLREAIAGGAPQRSVWRAGVRLT
ncbi:MAG: amidohydrolase family protein [Ilumatobacteraceae bacterium]